MLLLREVDRRLKLTERVAAVLEDPRDPDLITHSLLDLIRQRVYGLRQGDEELNDHGELLLVSYLRPAKIDGAKHAWAVLALPVKQRAVCQSSYAADTWHTARRVVARPEHSDLRSSQSVSPPENRAKR